MELTAGALSGRAELRRERFHRREAPAFSVRAVIYQHGAANIKERMGRPTHLAPTREYTPHTKKHTQNTNTHTARPVPTKYGAGSGRGAV
eukprot:scaffold38836_cov67-Phaeocystis_antarctica.AAC.2